MKTSIDLGWITNLKLLVETYQEIAASRMRAIRSSVLQTRAFNTGLITIYQEVKFSYKNDLTSISQKHQGKKNNSMSFIKRNGKTVAVFISANTGLYGDIVRNTFELFNTFILNHPSDVVIIGKLGKRMYEAAYPGHNYLYFDFSDTSIDVDKLHEIIKQLVSYEQLMLFYAQYENLAVQKPVMLDLYAEGKLQESIIENKTKYFFEPSLEEIMVFFETEIYNSFFQQTVYESDLAKFAARLFTLDQAAENIKKSLKVIKLEESILRHRANSKKQATTLAAVSLLQKNY